MEKESLMSTIRVMIVIFCVCFAPAIVGAVDTPRAYFSVTDKSGALVAGATVRIGGSQKQCITNQFGKCNIDFETVAEMRNMCAFAEKGDMSSDLALIATGMTTLFTIE